MATYGTKPPMTSYQTPRGDYYQFRMGELQDSFQKARPGLDPRQSYAWSKIGGGDFKTAYQKYRGADITERSLDPYADVGRVNQLYYSDPGVSGATGAYNQSMQSAQGAAEGFGNNARGFLRGVTPQLYNQAMGRGSSYVNKAANAQRMNAQRSIAQQAMMGAGSGGLSPAAQRAAIMGASNVQSQMAADVAAARAQERQQAMQQFIQARQAQLGAAQQNVSNQAQMADLRGQAMDRFNTSFGARIGAAAQGHEQLTSALANNKRLNKTVRYGL